MIQPQWSGRAVQSPPAAPWNPQPQWPGQAAWYPPPPGAGALPTPSPGSAGPRGRNPLKLLLLALIGVSLLALAGLVLVGLTVRPVEIAYANEDYQVPAAELNPPPIPVAESFEQAQEWVASNALYAQTTPAPVRCEVPPIDVATADNALLKTHFESLMECLVRVWEPPLTQAGFEIYRPTVTIYDQEITTKCGSGKLPQNAFYCGADQQIYWSSTLGAVLAPFSVSKRAGDEVMAHEFGHAVQGRSGILTSKNWIISEAPDKAAALEVARRNETQADCLAGMFVRSVSVSLALQQSDVAQIEENFANGGDDVLSGKPDIVGNHGRGPSRRYWGTTGLTTDQVGECNTYVAPPNLVR
ncbi:MAG TPA: neutral zinc metallopeptidase [Propionibacteriaceae bacterium]|nr:neutral zinc metallopeptidase [Propionibacteriaceae bacterium]